MYLYPTSPIRGLITSLEFCSDCGSWVYCRLKCLTWTDLTEKLNNLPGKHTESNRHILFLADISFIRLEFVPFDVLVHRTRCKMLPERFSPVITILFVCMAFSAGRCEYNTPSLLNFLMLSLISFCCATPPPPHCWTNNHFLCGLYSS